MALQAFVVNPYNTGALFVPSKTATIDDVTGNVNFGGTLTAGGFIGPVTGTATAVAGGTAGQFLYQSAPSVTAFTSNIFRASSGNILVGTTVDGGRAFEVIGNTALGDVFATGTVFDMVAAVRPLVVSAADTNTTLGGSLAAFTIANSNPTTSNTAQLNFAAITGASGNLYSSAVIACLFGARTNGQYPIGTLTFLTSSIPNAAPSEKMRLLNSGLLYVGNSADTGSGQLVQLTSTSSGAGTVPLVLVNSASAANTAVALDFAPNINISLARMNALRTAGGGNTDLVWSTYNGSALVEGLRLTSSGNLTQAVTGATINGVQVINPQSATSANSSAITTVEAIVGTLGVAANTLATGQRFRCKLYGICTSSVANAVTLTLRFGTTGTTSDTTVAALTLTAAAAGTNIPFFMDFDLVAPSTTTLRAIAWLVNQGSTGINPGNGQIGVPTTSGALTNSAASFLSLGVKTAAATTSVTAQECAWEMVR